VKRVFVHLGLGIATLCCGGLVIFLWERVLLQWVQKNELAVAFWLMLADLELTVASVFLFVLWLVTLFRGAEHYIRFRGCLTYYCYCVGMVVFGSLFPTAIGVAAAWLYSLRWWAVGALLRLLEVGISAALLATVAIGIFVMVTHPFRKLSSKNV